MTLGARAGAAGWRRTAVKTAYLLLTEPALERIGMDPVARGMRRHLVSYLHLGEVRCFVGDLEPIPQPALAGVGGQAA